MKKMVNEKDIVIKEDDYNRIRISNQNSGINGFFLFLESYGIFKKWQCFNSFHMTDKSGRKLLRYLKKRYE